MKLRLWPRRASAEPAEEERPAEAIEPIVREAPPEPEPEPEPTAEPEPEGEPEGEPEPAPEVAQEPEPRPEPPAPELPERLALTIDEAKATIREAGGDVIQVGFLASAYRRHREEDPRSAETAAARRRLCELVAKRLKDRELLAPKGVFELLDERGTEPSQPEPGVTSPPS